MSYRIFIFLIINFAALGLGSLFTSSGVSSDWYANLNKAPWTPPGWVFGAAWTTIMVCFSFYMSYAWQSSIAKNALIALFTLQWILNVSWNPVFFKYHQSLGGLIIILSLTILVGGFLFGYFNHLKYKSIFILPYFIWLIIASSLNAFIFLKN